MTPIDYAKKCPFCGGNAILTTTADNAHGLLCVNAIFAAPKHGRHPTGAVMVRLTSMTFPTPPFIALFNDGIKGTRRMNNAEPNLERKHLRE